MQIYIIDSRSHDINMNICSTSLSCKTADMILVYLAYYVIAQ